MTSELLASLKRSFLIQDALTQAVKGGDVQAIANTLPAAIKDDFLAIAQPVKDAVIQAKPAQVQAPK